MKSIYLVLGVLLATSIGCSTIKGIGQDIQGLGNGITNMADKVRAGIDKSND